MAYTVSVNPEARLAVLRFSGNVTGPEFHQAKQDILADPCWQEGLRELCDCREMTRLDVNVEELRQLAHFTDQLHREEAFGPIAIIVRRDLDHLVATIYRTLHTEAKEDIRIFWTLRQALEWLGLKKLPEKV